MYESHNQRLFARQLRKEMTDAERKLWSALRKRQLCGCRFRRQFAVGPYVVDFECFEKRLIVELDGGQHNSEVGRAHDAERSRYLAERGYSVLRFWNYDVMDDLNSVLEVIARRLVKPAQGRPHPSPPPEGEGTSAR